MKIDKKPDNFVFYGVALGLIILGAGILAVGLVYWILNFFWGFHMTFPSSKVMGGAVIAALGYIVLELELLRAK